ncbi:MAG TPA: hypothetical protein VI231_00410 [Candidatus Binatia bacterium]
MKVKIEFDSSAKGAENPAGFILGDRSIKVQAVMDRWYSPQGSYYRVSGDDGNVYILKGPAGEELWELVSFTHKDSRGTEPEFDGSKDLQ